MIKFMKYPYFYGLVLIIIFNLIHAQDVNKIMAVVDSVENQSYHSSVRRWSFSTCNYVIDNNKMKCSEIPRNLLLENIHEDYPVKTASGKTEYDSKSLDIIIEPVREKGSCLLAYAYYQEEKDTDFWIYLPALGKVKRILAANEDGEAASLFGSEYYIEDAVPRKLKDYTYELLGEGEFNGRPVWKVQSLPTIRRMNKTAYSKVESLIDKERYVILKDNFYDKHQKMFKQLSVREVKKIDGIWTITKTSMNNLRTHRITNYEVLSIGFNMDIEDEIFTQRSLTDFAYREKKLVLYRKFMK